VPALSSDGRARLLALYGGRSLDVLALATDEPPLQKTIDPARSVLAAEVVFALREEFARNLEDIVYRRLMVGLDADQGRSLYEVIAAIAGAELGWSESTRHAQLDALRAYSDSFGV
jgi:glycerol-3-phosphate dehydrogenase